MKNESAFPLYVPGKLVDKVFLGMTLRDWFAGQALAGMMSRDSFDPGQATPQQRSLLAYIEADAILAARKQEATDE